MTTPSTTTTAEPDTRLEVTVPVPLARAREQVEHALKDEGFGVLTDIDVAGVFRERLGGEHEPLEILGACNPLLAHRALSADPDAALLLPCNVVLREQAPGATTVTFADPRALLGRSAAAPVAAEAAERLARVRAALAS
jgi:uncharacterized protein (DUF302 family)